MGRKGDFGDTSGTGRNAQNATLNTNEELGITRVENGREVIEKDGAKYVKEDGAFVRANGYGLSGNGEKPTLNKVLNGRSVDEAAYHMIDETKYSAGKAGAEEKYAQLERVAKGDMGGTDYSYDNFTRREMAAGAGSEYGQYNRRGNFESWKSERLSDRTETYSHGGKSYGANYASGLQQLQHDLGSRVPKTVQSSMQKQAAQWLKDNPNMEGQKGWKFNGRKWVKKA
jgi:hypothetical protein